jgi:DNA repair exonuclease SbcCD ATPase subunit
MEINNNRDYIYFKNDVLKEIHGLDKRLSEQIKIKNKSYDTILCDIRERLEKIEKDNKAFTLSIFELKTKINQFNELFTYKQTIDNTFYSQEMRIKITMEELYRLKSKYEKTINDNLIIPGLIGGSSRFKNLKDYIQFFSMEMSRVKSWQEERKKLDVEFKKKLIIYLSPWCPCLIQQLSKIKSIMNKSKKII